MEYNHTEMLKYGIEEAEGRFVGHEPCDNCQSSDAKAVYDNGHKGFATHCFSCNTHKKYDTDYQPVTQGASKPSLSAAEETFQKDLLTGSHEALPARGLSQETCKKMGYEVGTYNGEPVHIASYYNANGVKIAQKIRFKDKRFKVIGKGGSLPLFGSHKWSKGKLILTEGEIDAVSVAQVIQKLAVCSLPQGAQGAVRAIKDNWEYISGFDEVVLCFDMDEHGRKAAQQVAELLPVGKAKIAHLPLKDANECLVEGRGRDIVSAIFEARTYRPDGIVAATDIRDALAVADAASAVSYPYKRLNEITLGLRKEELVLLSAGTGVGKSTLAREIAYKLHMEGHRVGMIMLEESNKKTILSMVGLHMNKNIAVDREGVELADIYQAFDEMFDGNNPMYLFDHFGSSEVETIIQRIHYMAKALDVDWIILDHISIMVSGLHVGDERKALDVAATALRTAVSQLKIGMLMVSHLRRPEGDKGHEEGAKVRLNQLRGTHGIAHVSDIVIGLQVDPDDPDGDYRYLHVIKNRFTGECGVAGKVKYLRDSGRLLDAADTF